jgi:hypothetical protein
MNWDHLGVGAKVAIASEDLPSTSDCHSADQKIDTGSSNASAPAFVAPVRGPFEILGAQSFIPKSAQLIAQSNAIRSSSIWLRRPLCLLRARDQMPVSTSTAT